jgi:hypothetical protein
MDYTFLIMEILIIQYARAVRSRDFMPAIDA